MSYFDGIQVGDRVWSVESGWGFVAQIQDSRYPILVEFKEDVTAYTIDGKYYSYSAGQSLFWDEIKITPPPRPKKKEKKTAECVANVYDKVEKGGLLMMGRKFFFHENKAKSRGFSAESKLLAVAKVTIEWEE